jgi:hypothetical protein
MSVTRRTIIIAIAVVALLVATPAYLRRNSAAKLLNPNSPPVAVDDSYTVHGPTSIGPFLANDSDADGDSISFYNIVSSPAHGSLSGGAQPDRKYYTPQQGYSGPDSFTYSIRDSLLNVSIFNERQHRQPDLWLRES